MAEYNPLWPDAAMPALAHDSAHLHVAGLARYVDDEPELPGTLHLAFGLSSEARARIVSVDLAAVRAFPGVVAAYTAADIPGENNVGPIAHDDRVLANGEVVSHGQPVFLVAAETRAAARKAARLGKVTYEQLEPAITVEAARSAGSRIEADQRMTRGDAGQALAEAEYRLAGSLRIGAQDHFYLEGQVAHARPGEDGQIHVVSSSQHPSEVQHLVAHLLGRPSADVTVEVRRMGGAFGGKESQAALFAAAAALVVHRTGRPAKFRCDRDDDMIVTGKRHDFEVDYEVGHDGEGRLSAVKLRFGGRCGATMDLSPSINDRTMFHADNCYFLRDVEILSERLKTNTVSATAFRGFGGPQGMLAIERVCDHVAARLGLDPLDVRVRNLYGPGRDVTPYGMRLEDNIAPQMIAQLRETSRYEARREAIAAFNAGSPVLKKGIALTPVKFGISFTTKHLNQAGALVHVYADGSIQANHGGTEMGQGLHIKIAKIVADVFGMGADTVRITATRTDKVPNTSATAASSGADLNGMAAWRAAMAIRARMADFLAAAFGCAAEDVQFSAGSVSAGEVRLSFAEAARKAWMGRISLSSTGFYATPELDYDRAAHRGRPFYYFAYGAAVSEVVVDTLTGEHKVLAVDILHDVGRSLNPAIDRGQIEGGFVQGQGWLTTEVVEWDAQGRLLGHSPATYKVPTASDRPKRMQIDLWDGDNVKPTIHRSKAVGEPPLMLANSVFCAISAAIAASAPEVRELPRLNAPATPEAVLCAIAGMRAA